MTACALLYDYDDGLAVYLNGALILSVNVPEGMTHESTADGSHEATGELARLEFSDPEVLAQLREGANCLAAVGLNSSLGSSDLTLKVAFELTGGLAAQPTDVVWAHSEFAQRATPNPFVTRTAVRFALPSPGAASLKIYDVAGRLVRRISATQLERGTHSLAWDGRLQDGSRSPAGVYFYRLETRGLEHRGKLIHVR